MIALKTIISQIKLKNGVKLNISHNDETNVLVFCKNLLIGIGDIKDNKTRFVLASKKQINLINI